MTEQNNITQGERAVEELIALIREGNYGPGDKLPTEKELSETLGIGKNILREALRALVSRNIVVIRQGAGTFLTEKPGVVEDPFGFRLVKNERKVVADLLQVRSILEPPIAALAAQNRTEEECSVLEEILAEMEEQMKKRADYFEYDARFHEQIAICSHNGIMEDLIPVITEGVRMFAKEVATQEYDHTLVSHRKICEAIRRKCPMEAQQAMMYHILYNNERYENEKGKENV